MTDWLSVMERGLKAVRFGIFQASDNLAMLLDGFCRAPEPPADPWAPIDPEFMEQLRGQAWEYAAQTAVPPFPRLIAGCNGECTNCICTKNSAASPQVAVVAPSPKQGSDSGPADCDVRMSLSAGPHPHQRDLPPPQHLLRDGARAIQFWLNGVPPSRYTRDEWEVLTVYMRQLAEDLEARK